MESVPAVVHLPEKQEIIGRRSVPPDGPDCQSGRRGHRAQLRTPVLGTAKTILQVAIKRCLCSFRKLFTSQGPYHVLRPW